MARRWLPVLLLLVRSATTLARGRTGDNCRSSDDPSDGRLRIRVGAIFPNSHLTKRLYQCTTLSNLLGDLNNDKGRRYNFTRFYKLYEETEFLPAEVFPVEVLKVLCNVMIKQQVSVILHMTNSEEYGMSTASTQYLMHMASFTGIPMLAWNADNSGILTDKNLNDYRILQMAPPLQHQTAAMAQLLVRYRWQKFAVVTTQIAGATNFLRLFRQEEMDARRQPRLEIIEHVQLDLQNLNNLTKAAEQMAQLAETDARIFLLYATRHEADEIMKMANEARLTGVHYLWIVAQPIVGASWQRRLPEQYQVGMLGIHFETAATPRTNALVPQIKNAINILATALESLVASLGTSVRLNSTSNCNSDFDFTWKGGAKVYQHLKAATIAAQSIDIGNQRQLSGFRLSFDERGYVKHSYLSILNLRPNYRWEEVGHYMPDSGLQITDMTWPGNRTSPPQGTPEKFHVKVVSLDEPPFMIVGELEPETQRCPGNQGVLCDWATADDPANTTVWKCCTGYCVDLLNKLAEDVGFTYDLYRVRDGKWGIKTVRALGDARRRTSAQEAGWNGLIKDVVDLKADMCVTSLKINSERAKVIDFSVPFLETGIAIIVKIKRGRLSPTAFLEPFEYYTWVFILIVSIQGAAVAIFVYEWFSPDSFNMGKQPAAGHKFSLFRSYWLVWATLFSASVNTDVPRSSTARFMALVWAAFALTFLAVYTANLAAFMITRTEHHDLTGIDDPAITNPWDRQPVFSYGTVEGGNTHETLKRNYHKLHRFIESGDATGNRYFRDNVSAGVRAVKNEELQAFIYDAVVLDFQVGKDDDCSILTVGKWFSETGYAFGFPKNSVHQKKINQFILQYQQIGYLERLQSFWLTGACSPKTADRMTQSQPLGIENFISAFALLAGGTVCGMIVLCLELLYCRYLRRYLVKVDRSGWCGLVSMSLGRSLTFEQAARHVHKSVTRSAAMPKPSSSEASREQVLSRQLQDAHLELERMRTLLRRRR